MTHFRWLSVRRQFLSKITRKLYILTTEALQNSLVSLKERKDSWKCREFFDNWEYLRKLSEVIRSLISLVELDLFIDLTREFWSGEISIYSVTWLQQSPQNSDVCWSTPGVAASWTPVVVDEGAASYGVGTLMPPTVALTDKGAHSWHFELFVPCTKLTLYLRDSIVTNLKIAVY